MKRAVPQQLTVVIRHIVTDRNVHAQLSDVGFAESVGAAIANAVSQRDSSPPTRSVQSQIALAVAGAIGAPTRPSQRTEATGGTAL